MTNTIFKAEYADFKNVKTRSVAQFVFEVPIEEANNIIQMLGLPNAGQPQWFGIAKLNSGHASQQTAPGGLPAQQTASPVNYTPSQRAKQKFRSAIFRDFLGATDEVSADIKLKQKLGIKSKSELDSDTDAFARWKALLLEFDEWVVKQEEIQRGRG